MVRLAWGLCIGFALAYDNKEIIIVLPFIVIGIKKVNIMKIIVLLFVLLSSVLILTDVFLNGSNL